MAAFHCRLLKTVPTHQELCTFQSYYYGNMSYYFNRLYRKKKYFSFESKSPSSSNLKHKNSCSFFVYSYDYEFCLLHCFCMPDPYLF